MKHTKVWELGPHELRDAVLAYMKARLDMNPDASVSPTIEVTFFNSTDHNGATFAKVTVRSGKAH
jgi:hypothetical protein